MTATARVAVLLLLVECPADRRAHAEHAATAHAMRARPVTGSRRAVAGDVELVPPVRRGVGERVTLILPGREIQKRGGVPVDAALRARGEQHDQPIGVRERQRTQQQCVHDVEDGGRRANAERERQYRHRRKARMAPHHPKRPTNVLDQPLGARPAPGVARRLADEGRVAEVLLRRELAPGPQSARRRPVRPPLRRDETGSLRRAPIPYGSNSRASEGARRTAAA